MSILNLGLQCVGLARSEMPEQFEKEVSKCNSLSELRKILSRGDGTELAVQDSVSPVKILLCSIFSHLKFKNNCFLTFTSTEIGDLWTAIIPIDAHCKN